MNYYAVEKESGKEQVFQDEKSRNFSVDVIGTHEAPRDEMAESVEIDILRSMAAIYKTQEEYDKQESKFKLVFHTHFSEDKVRPRKTGMVNLSFDRKSNKFSIDAPSFRYLKFQ